MSLFQHELFYTIRLQCYAGITLGYAVLFGAIVHRVTCGYTGLHSYTGLHTYAGVTHSYIGVHGVT